MAQRAYTALRLPLPYSLGDRYIRNANHCAEATYRPRPTPAPMALFLGEGISDEAPGAWRRLAAGPFELEWIPLGHSGVEPDDSHLRSHRQIMKEPHVSLLAERLGACLDRHRAAPAQMESRRRRLHQAIAKTHRNERSACAILSLERIEMTFIPARLKNEQALTPFDRVNLRARPQSLTCTGSGEVAEEERAETLESIQPPSAGALAARSLM